MKGASSTYLALYNGLSAALWAITCGGLLYSSFARCVP